MHHYQRRELKNKTVLVGETHPHMHGVSVGLWVKTGSAFELSSHNGISHFIEHLVFKGTKKRKALEIVSVLESVGGDLNAFTDREYTCYHASVLNEHLPLAFLVMCYVVTNPKFPSKQIELERKVLFQEMAMVEDTPDEWGLDLFLSMVWQNKGFGLPIIGSKRSVNKIDRREIVKYFKRWYRPENMVVSIAGNFDFEKAAVQLENSLDTNAPQKTSPQPEPLLSYVPGKKYVHSGGEQSHLYIGFEAGGLRDPGRLDALVLSYYLGGGMSSRLYQEIREKLGLAYHVDADFIPYSKGGVFTFYAATKPSSVKKTVEVLKNEVSRLLKRPIDEKKLEETKGLIIGSIKMSLDQMESCQESLGRNEVMFQTYVELEEMVQKIKAVTPEKLYDICKRWFLPEKESVVIVGPKKLDANKISLF